MTRASPFFLYSLTLPFSGPPYTTLLGSAIPLLYSGILLFGVLFPQIFGFRSSRLWFLFIASPRLGFFLRIFVPRP